jgi:hypothetical protein
MDKVPSYKPSPWPRCRDRQRLAEIRVGDRRRICAETYRHGNDVGVVCLWPEVSVGRGWRQSGNPVSMPARAFDLIIREYTWNGAMASASANEETSNGKVQLLQRR